MCYKEATLQCKRCLKTVYCSPDCQKGHWQLGHGKYCVARPVENANGSLDEESTENMAIQYVRNRTMTVEQLVDAMEKSATVRKSVAAIDLANFWERLARDTPSKPELIRRLAAQLQDAPQAIPNLLVEVAKFKRVGIFQIFIEVGAVPNLNVTWHGETTPLIEAVGTGKAGRYLVGDLIERGADVNYYPWRGEYGSSLIDAKLESSAHRPIITALLLGDSDIISRLLNAGAIVDNKSMAFLAALGRATYNDLTQGSGFLVSYADPDHLADLSVRSLGAFLLVYGMTNRVGPPQLYEEILRSATGPGLVRMLRLLGITPAYRIRSPEALEEARSRSSSVRNRSFVVSKDTLLNIVAFSRNIEVLKTMLTLVSNSDLRLTGDHDWTPLVSLIQWHKDLGWTEQAHQVALEIVDRGGADFPASSRQSTLAIELLQQTPKSDAVSKLLQAITESQRRVASRTQL
jgi:hypothetical protein